MSADPDQLPLFPEAPTTMPHDEPPITLEWMTDASGHVHCMLTADCGCAGTIVQTAKRITAHAEWRAAIDDAMLHTLRGAVELLSDHEDNPAHGVTRALTWMSQQHALIRVGWETALPFTNTTH
jgi:hypothetical protein